jgi:osmotically inducible protein OsmC
MKRTASAEWKGTGKEGKGTLTTQSGVLKNNPYSYLTRFENEPGTNPEELIGAAHAGCFSMKLSFVISGAGFTPDSINTTATVTLENGAISDIHLDVKASIPNASEGQFKEWAEDAKKNCPVSKLFNANITMDAKLV